VITGRTIEKELLESGHIRYYAVRVAHAPQPARVSAHVMRSKQLRILNPTGKANDVPEICALAGVMDVPREEAAVGS
jgi:hypothetical protein